MSRFKEFLKQELKDDIPEQQLDLLPSGYQRIGDIIIIKLPRGLEKYKKEIGKTIQKKYHVIKSICLRKDIIRTDKRKPLIEIIAGKGSETVHKEYGCKFQIDVKKLMFSKGNLEERTRLSKAVGWNETVVDMFCGLGYFSVPIARFSKPRKIIAIDINPTAIKYLKKNIKLNYVRCIEPILGDCRKISSKYTDCADRVLMGFLPDTKEYLPYAFKFLKDNGIIHFHDICEEKDLWNRPINILDGMAKSNGYTVKKVLHKRKVKLFAPRRWHIVIDVYFERASS